MKMVERMAQAICNADAWPLGRGESGNLVAQHLALAALKAMREPTDAMSMEPGPCFDEAACIEAARVWKTMIDVAIKEAEAE